MIPVKVICVCGQKYAFEAEPVQGRMPHPVKCPVCGADGTMAANEIIAQTLAGSPPPVPGAPLHRAPAPATARVATPAAPVPPSPAKRGSKPRLLAVVAAALVLLAGGGLAAWKFLGNAGPVATVTTPLAPGLPNTLAELNQWYAEPPEGQNAATYFQKGFDALNITDADRNSASLPFFGKEAQLPAPGTELTPARRKVIGDFLQRNRPAMEFFKQGLKFPQSRYPLDFTQGSELRLPHLAKMRQAGQLSALLAVSLADQKHASAAANEIVNVLLAGSGHTLSSEPLLISQLVRAACAGDAMKGLEQVVNQVGLPPAALDELRARLKAGEQQEAGGEPFTRAFVGERALGLANFDLPPARLAERLKQAADSADSKLDMKKLMANLKSQRTFYEETLNRVIQMRREPLPGRLQVTNYFNARGREAETNHYYLSSLLLPAGGGPARKEARLVAVLRLTQTAVELERFRGTHQGSYPDSLAALTPDYLPHLPADPFDGQPLRYHKSATGYRLYSLGSNLQDDGGQRGDPSGGNIGFEVVKAPPVSDEFNRSQDKVSAPSGADSQQQLKDLKTLFDQGKIDQPTYEQRKNAILKSL